MIGRALCYTLAYNVHSSCQFDVQIGIMDFHTTLQVRAAAAAMPAGAAAAQTQPLLVDLRWRAATRCGAAARNSPSILICRVELGASDASP